MQVEVKEMHPDPGGAEQWPNLEHFLFSICDMVHESGASAGRSCHRTSVSPRSTSDAKEHDCFGVSHERKTAGASTSGRSERASKSDSKLSCLDHLRALTSAFNTGVRLLHLCVVLRYARCTD